MKNMVTRVTRCKVQHFLTGSCNFAWLLVGYSVGTRWLLDYALLQLFDTVFMKYPIKRDTDLDKNAGVLFEKCYFLLHL